MDKFDETAHGDEDNNPNDEAYGDIMVEEHPDQDDIFDGTYEKYIGAEVIMVVPGEDPRQSTVRRCVNYLDRNKVGTYHSSQIIDTQENELEYDYRTHDCYFANIIDENLYSQVDSEEHRFSILELISNHRSDGMDINVADGFIIIWGRNKNLNKKAHELELLTQMKESF